MRCELCNVGGLTRHCAARGLLALDLQRDVDELVFLAADEFALAGPVEQLMGRARRSARPGGWRA